MTRRSLQRAAIAMALILLMIIQSRAQDDDGKASDLHALQVSAPDVDFDCGDSTPVEVPSVFGVSRVSRSTLEKDSLAAEGIALTDNIHGVVGGMPARFVLAKYTVLVGDQDSRGNIDWFCDGSLINAHWILTAAHCFQRRSASVVRLGEHDYSTTRDGNGHEDFPVGATVLYPEYRLPQSYHDLALVKLGRRVVFSSYINPVCLPWGREAEKDLTGKVVTVTGWGATVHGGSGSTVLQEVSLTAFPSSRCDQSYSNLPQYPRNWPKGIGNETLCAGDPQGGKDACQGDSGGPLVYLDERRRHVLAGVVSSGYGCGLKEFPGLYADLRQAPYLSWIKRVAFN
ncbi:venom peptide isomerase heavy chain-like [Penaeus chinensis]|uniref:venom peptide isomerase heavy chain-like n=1 Tax=Penaeus chinensis TaxID=139456 RepID=UPI001FB6029E|nr:venom peptide isomerase heavy chain-like [Penaeus chinensis]XP_047470626.1 venom peptide isomerase heavy chain-like [Penaeus chinensis]XP_047470627.1 venom peptide isomerase heavy chain-like [Penaeus chinensis]